jgi:N-acetyl-gamma-glutamyl-phosphate reductase
MPLYKNGVVGGQVIIDAKSGVTGAGRKPSVAMSFGEVSENFKAYKINEHQHIPEITKILKEICGKDPGINFVPHLLPVRRGILSTMYVNLSKDMTQADINGLYKEFYKNEPFVRVYPEGQQPELKNCVNTNYCDIGLKLKGRLLVVVSCIDNLLKGAAGQAVQNMNIMCGFDEKQALVRG